MGCGQSDDVRPVEKRSTQYSNIGSDGIRKNTGVGKKGNLKLNLITISDK
jgi:hypothetical protein